MSTKSTRSFCQRLVWQKNSGGSSILFEVRIPNLVDGLTSWDGGVVHTILGHIDIEFWPHF